MKPEETKEQLHPSDQTYVLPVMDYECHGCSAEITEDDWELIGPWRYCQDCADAVWAMREAE